MSLLIKALDKAQAEKAGASKDTASKKTAAKTKSEKLVKKKSAKSAEALQKTEPNTADKLEITPPTKTANTNPPSEPVRAQAQAANVFTAKSAEPSNHTAKVAVLLGLLALGLMAALAYWYQTVFNTPEIVIPPRPVAQQEMPKPMAEVVTEENMPLGAELEVVEPEMIDSSEADIAQQSVESITAAEIPKADAEQVVDHVEKQATTVFNTASQVNEGVVTPAVEETLTKNESVMETDVTLANSELPANDTELMAENASITITPNKIESGINKVLMRAYEAYNAGNDQQAAQDYKAVLKRYGANVDVMLGLGAIATRQGRAADANGWYRKVLEVEPRNEVAKAGMLSLQQGQPNQPQTNESNFKAMIATSPNDANLHAALGDVYANQNQWPAAQQAYFDAYRLSQSAENAFNLGVSLDQLGKPALALPYYREALQKAEQSSVIDVEALQARILSIE